MAISQTTQLNYYATPGRMTDPGPYAFLLEDLPTQLPGLVKLIQNNLIHVFWAERYGVHLPEERKQTLQVRSIAEKLRILNQDDPRPLAVERLPAERQVGNCRDFTVFLVSFLQRQGIPARARCGFGTYFMPDHYEDHWVCEMWDASLGRWKLVDAQLDAFQQKALKVSFDPLDVPYDQFIVGGQAWNMCRQGLAQPEQFGIFDMNGWWFIWGNVVRDFLSFNKVELLPWDWTPELFTRRLEDPLPGPGEELAFYDEVAGLSAQADAAIDRIRSWYETDARWRIPADWN
jgi:hypothetical protein